MNYKHKISAIFFIILSILMGSKNIYSEENSKGEVSLKGPKISIESLSHNFGEVKEGEVKEKDFVVTNIGDEDLIIDKVYTSCGCTTAQINSSIISPKEKAILKVSYNGKGKVEGEDSKDIYIESNDSSQPKLKITITAKIVNPVRNIFSNGVKEESMSSDSGTIPKITSEELYSRLQHKNAIIILDVREENEYKERHIPEAVWFPKSKFDKGDAMNEEILEGIDKNTILVSYCGAGHRSSYVTRKLGERGFNAYNLEGISFWEKKGYPLVRGPKLPPSMEPAVIHLEEAYKHYYKLFKDIVWIDVRNKDDYEKGHIKGAINIPLSELEDNLKLISRDKEIVIYCEGTWEGGKCDASMSAGRILIKDGFKQGNIKVFEDGYGTWENADYPVEKN